MANVHQAKEPHQIGSYGLMGKCAGKPTRGDEVIRPWFCGQKRIGQIPGTVGSVCAHNTKKEAEECLKRGSCAHEWHRGGTVNGKEDIYCQLCGATQD